MDIIINDLSTTIPTDAMFIDHCHDYYLNLLNILGYPLEKPPLADLLRLYQNQKSGQWLVLSPIRWQASYNDAQITAYGKALFLNYEKGYQWFEEVAAFLASENLNLIYHSPSLWLVDIADKPNLETLALARELSMRNLIHPSNKYWLRLMTEVQMWLTNHPLNKEGNNTYINGLWPWGNGTFKKNCDKKIITNDKVISYYLNADDFFPNACLKSYDLLVLNPKPVCLDWQDPLQLKSSRWFWNDCAYQLKNKNWWQRLIRK